MDRLLSPNFLSVEQELDIIDGSIEPAPFQGEICSVFNARSDRYGALVIKAAQKAQQDSQEGREEIRQNKEGYSCIPDEFRPEMLAADSEDTYIVMPHAGQPLRDVLWAHSDSAEASADITDVFLANLSRLLTLTKTQDDDAKNSYLDQLEAMGQFFLQNDIFPDSLRTVFAQAIDRVRSSPDNTVAFATLDFTQGNLLVDITANPPTLKVIDPKRPRMVRGNPTFLGIPEVDLGMFAATLCLNAPPIVHDLAIDERLKGIGRELRDDKQMSDTAFELGKLFGCILIASFPNTAERVETYLRSVDTDYGNRAPAPAADEREAHIQMALQIADKINEAAL